MFSCFMNHPMYCLNIKLTTFYSHIRANSVKVYSKLFEESTYCLSEFSKILKNGTDKTYKTDETNKNFGSCTDF